MFEPGKIITAEFHMTLRPHVPTQFINVTLFVRKSDQTGKEIFYAVGWLVVHYRPQSQVSFDIRQVVQHWRQSHQLVGKLLVQVVKLNSEAIHVVNSTHMHNFFYSGARNGPCLVVYLAGTQDTPLGIKFTNSDIIQLPAAVKPIHSSGICCNI